MNNTITNFILGVPLEKIHSKVVIAPCWLPESVGLTAEKIHSGSCNIWNCRIEDIEFNYIVIGVGAANCLDTVAALGNTKCEEILFIGSAGALKKGINIGDIALPSEIMCYEGASRYIKNIAIDNYGQKYRVDEQLYNQLCSYIGNNDKFSKVSLHTGAGVSVESIFFQQKYIPVFKENRCDFIDMESSAFLAAASSTNIKGVVAYCISDNAAQNEPLHSISQDTVSFRKELRKELFPEIIACFLKGKTI